MVFYICFVISNAQANKSFFNEAKNLYEKKILGNQLVENIASDIEKKLKEFIRAN